MEKVPTAPFSHLFEFGFNRWIFQDRVFNHNCSFSITVGVFQSQRDVFYQKPLRYLLFLDTNLLLSTYTILGLLPQVERARFDGEEHERGSRVANGSVSGRCLLTLASAKAFFILKEKKHQNPTTTTRELEDCKGEGDHFFFQQQKILFGYIHSQHLTIAVWTLKIHHQYRTLTFLGRTRENTQQQLLRAHTPLSTYCQRTRAKKTTIITDHNRLITEGKPHGHP
ncbi:hypothetical protein V8G54_000657 [Vigna mungo]|uniref:Uncharacterized protein n=1 Tax=Vigna mungo TaxID=3915 RepID=A0AAQ3SA66_VIGMU